jgi:hypothetical protein
MEMRYHVSGREGLPSGLRHCDGNLLDAVVAEQHQAYVIMILAWVWKPGWSSKRVQYHEEGFIWQGYCLDLLLYLPSVGRFLPPIPPSRESLAREGMCRQIWGLHRGTSA